MADPAFSKEGNEGGMSVLMVFLDGVGFGGTDPSVNPLVGDRLRLLPSLLGHSPPQYPASSPGSISVLRLLDANLGIEGLPQSGTGQTALFTGVNAATLLGRHFGPYPHSALRTVLEQQNIFLRLMQGGKTVCFANAFPGRFFDHMESRPTRLTVTTLSCNLSGVPLLRAGDLMDGRAVSADITGEGWAELGYPEIPQVEPEEAGRRLRALTQRFDFVLFEYWKTDHAGHSMDCEEATNVLTLLDRMLHGFMSTEGSEEVLLLITSDHGNIEDISTKVHTRNPVPLILHGNGCRRMEEILTDLQGSDLTCVTPAIIRYILDDPGH